VNREPTHVVGIGASAGGLDALMHLVGRLPAGLRAAVCVVLHVPATGRSMLAPILARRTDLPVDVATDGEALQAGRIYVAPPDRHLTVRDGRVRLTRGSSGALAVRDAGGAVLVQDPGDATVSSMPESALGAVGEAAAVLSAAEIGQALAGLTAGAEMREDVSMTGPRDLSEHPERPPGPPSAFTCPECSGPLWESDQGGVVRYRCRVGHGFSEDALVGEQGTAVETALWVALESLEERADFLLRLAARHAESRPRLHARYEHAAADATARAELIRTALGIRGEHPHALDLPAEAVE
jgi:two-component system chemotaxis response regulator CheB